MSRVKAAKRSVYANTPGLPVAFTLSLPFPGSTFVVDDELMDGTSVELIVDNDGRNVDLVDIATGITILTLRFTTIRET